MTNGRKGESKGTAKLNLALASRLCGRILYLLEPVLLTDKS